MGRLKHTLPEPGTDDFRAEALASDRLFDEADLEGGTLVTDTGDLDVVMLRLVCGSALGGPDGPREVTYILLTPAQAESLGTALAAVGLHVEDRRAAAG